MEMTDELRERFEKILLSNASGIDVLKDIHNRDENPGSEFDRIINSMHSAYQLDRSEMYTRGEVEKIAIEVWKKGYLSRYYHTEVSAAQHINLIIDSQPPNQK